MKNWRKTKEYRRWKVRVVRRDKRCQVCGSIKKRNAHHINHATYFPEQRFDENNGICLCRDCHTNYHCNYLRSFRAKCTRYNLDNFFSLLRYIKTINIINI